MISRGFFLVIVLYTSATLAELICYECNGKSDTQGQYCSNGNLCYGPTCYFNVKDNGEWEAGCMKEKGEANSSTQACAYSAGSTQCQCLGDFCNKLTDTLTFLQTYWKSVVPDKTITPFLPSDPAIPCFECGIIKINGTTMELPCDKQHLCHGGYCMTVKGEFPYSFCATSWEGSSEVRCNKEPGQEERCVCEGQMCNYPYDPEHMPPTKPPTTTTTTVPTTPGAVTTTPPTVPPTKPNTTNPNCDGTHRFNPNQQAVFMGNKLKDIIMNGFGGGSKAVNNFQNGIDTHICAYSEHGSTTPPPTG